MSTDPAVVVANRYARGAVVAAVVIAACWHLGFDLPSLLTNWPVYRWPGLAAAAWLGYVAIGAVAAVVLLRAAESPAVARLLAVASLLVTAAVIVACPADAVHAPANWASGSVGWLAVIVLWRSRLRELLAFLAVDALLMLAAMALGGALDRFSFARYVMVVLGAVTLQLGYSIGTHSFGIAARWAAANSAARAEAMGRQASTEAVALARAERYRMLRTITAAVLGELAAGADPADPEIRRRSAAAATRLRRLMAETDDEPAPLLHEIRACADIAERRGVLVSLTVLGTLPTPPVEIRRAITEAPVEALSGARTHARVTIVGTDDSVVLSVVADTPDVEIQPYADVHIATFREDDRLWIETRWPPR